MSLNLETLANDGTFLEVLELSLAFGFVTTARDGHQEPVLVALVETSWKTRGRDLTHFL